MFLDLHICDGAELAEGGFDVLVLEFEHAEGDFDAVKVMVGAEEAFGDFFAGRGGGIGVAVALKLVVEGAQGADVVRVAFELGLEEGAVARLRSDFVVNREDRGVSIHREQLIGASIVVSSLKLHEATG